MSNIVQVPASTANYTVGRLGYRVSGVIIHTIVGTLASADATFKNPARGASAHYGVACDGSVVHQYVLEGSIAWHCGRFYPDAGHPLANANTIGIEHCDDGHPFAPRSDAEYACSAQLVREICARYGIPVDRTHIRMHREVSVNPTGCPDTLDIDRIVREAQVHGPSPGQLGDDDMLLTGPLHSRPATLKAFVAGSTFRDPLNDARVVAGTVASGSSVEVDGYLYSSSPVTSPDLSTAAGNQPGPDPLWWHRKDGLGFVPDAILDTSGLTPPPPTTVPAGEAMRVYGTTSLAPDLSQLATKTELKAVADTIPTKATTQLTH